MILFRISGCAIYYYEDFHILWSWILRFYKCYKLKHRILHEIFKSVLIIIFTYNKATSTVVFSYGKKSLCFAPIYGLYLFKVEFKLSDKVLQFLLENFLFHDFAVKHFLDGYRSVHFTFVPFYYRIFLHFCEIFFLMNWVYIYFHGVKRM